MDDTANVCLWAARSNRGDFLAYLILIHLWKHDIYIGVHSGPRKSSQYYDICIATLGKITQKWRQGRKAREQHERLKESRLPRSATPRSCTITLTVDTTRIHKSSQYTYSSELLSWWVARRVSLDKWTSTQYSEYTIHAKNKSRTRLRMMPNWLSSRSVFVYLSIDARWSIIWILEAFTKHLHDWAEPTCS